MLWFPSDSAFVTVSCWISILPSWIYQCHPHRVPPVLWHHLWVSDQPLQNISHQSVKGPGKLERVEGGGYPHPETPWQQTKSKTTSGLWVWMDLAIGRGLKSLCRAGDWGMLASARAGAAPWHLQVPPWAHFAEITKLLLPFSEVMAQPPQGRWDRGFWEPLLQE